MLLFGEGGSAVEVVADTTLELPPLNLTLARRMVERTHVYRKMRGFRHVPPVDVDGVLGVLLRISQLVVDWPRIVELEINPLLANASGCVALDARLELLPPGAHAAELAVLPYPHELERTVRLRDGRTLLVRPIRPEDEPKLVRAFARLSPDDVHARLFVPTKALSHATAARLTQIDYDREMTLVLAEPGAAGAAELHAVARLAADPDKVGAELAVAVERELMGLGLGTLLMRHLIDYARSRGVGEIYGEISADDTVMRSLCRSLGFAESPAEDHVVRVTLRCK
jgi:acetyltransferase